MADSSGQAQALVPTGQSKAYDIDDLKEKFRKAKSIRERFVPDWALNLAFTYDDQWLRWNKGSGRLDKPIIADWRELVTDNRIKPVVTARAARKVKNRPAFVISPTTADEADIDASKIGEQVLESDWVTLNLQEKLFQAILFSEICGAGFWKVYWDSTVGDSGEYLFDGQNQPIKVNGRPVKAGSYEGSLDGIQAKTVSQGDVCVDVLSPFEIFPDPLARTLEDAEWVIEEKVRSTEYVKRRYNQVLTPDADAPIGPVEGRLFPSAVYGGSDAAGYKGIKVYEMWARPSTDYPTGKRCVWAGDQILHEDDQPFDPMPYTMFSCIRVPNRFWPSSIVTSLRGPQVHLNKIRSQIAMNAQRIGNPALMKSRQANVYYTGAPGEEILYDSTVPDAKPEYLLPPEVATYVREEIQRIEESMQEISGLHDVSNATVPSGVTAASAINLLQEADDTRIGPEIQDMETTLAKAGSKILKLRAAYNSDERIIRIAGEDGDWDIFSFKDEMLRGNTNAEVQAGSAMPRSKAAKQAAMLEFLQVLTQYGFPLDNRSLREFVKDYGVGALEKLFDDIGHDEAQVQREHRLLSQGTAVNINPWDDDAYHIDAHRDYEKTAKFANSGPNLVQLMELHIQAHMERQKQVIDMQVKAQADAMAAAQAAGGNGGGYPNPPREQLSTPAGGLSQQAVP